MLPAFLVDLFSVSCSLPGNTLELPFLGTRLEPNLACGIADGMVCPITKVLLIIDQVESCLPFMHQYTLQEPFQFTIPSSAPVSTSKASRGGMFQTSPGRPPKHGNLQRSVTHTPMNNTFKGVYQPSPSTTGSDWLEQNCYLIAMGDSFPSLLLSVFRQTTLPFLW